MLNLDIGPMHIDGNADVRRKIYGVCIILFVILSIYAILWIKKVMKKKLFETYEIKEVMAMEHELYLAAHNCNQKEKNV